MSLKIGQKTTISLAFLAFIILFLSAVSFFATRKIINNYTVVINGLQSKKETLLSLNSDMYQLLSLNSEFDFTLKEDFHAMSLGLYDKVYEDIDQVASIEEYISGSIETEDSDDVEESDELMQLKDDVKLLQQLNNSIYVKTENKGLTEEDGLRGEFRTAAHELEAIIAGHNLDNLMVKYLLIRRHEKDYLLRLDHKYVDKNTATADELRAMISHSLDTDDERTDANRILQQYQLSFSKIVAVNDELNSMFEKRHAIIEEIVSYLTSEKDEAIATIETELPRIQKISSLASLIVLVIAGFSILSAVLISILLNRNLKKSLSTALASADNLKKGDLSNLIEYKNQDEMGQIIQAVNSASKNLAALLRETSEIVSSGIRLSDGLSEESSDSFAAVEEIQANISSINKTTEDLTESSSFNTDAVNRIQSHIAELNSSMEAQSSEIIQSTASVEQMISNINNVSAISKQKETTVRELLLFTDKNLEDIRKTNTLTEEISGLTDSIMEITNVINSIASQTNLLAMNAAIEAAHAGDAGKGFAVVSDEIRKLAESSSVNAGQISSMLKNISEKIHTVAQTSGSNYQNYKNFQEVVTSFTNSFSEIVLSMNEMAIGGTQVLDSSEKMRDGLSGLTEKTNLITGDTVKIFNSTREVDNRINIIKQGLNEISAAVSHIYESSQSVVDKARENKSNISGIKSKLEFFNIEKD